MKNENFPILFTKVLCSNVNTMVFKNIFNIMNCCHEHSTKQLKISKIYSKKQLIFKEIFKKLFFIKYVFELKKCFQE